MLAILKYLYFPKGKHIIYTPLNYWSLFLENSFPPFLTYLNWIPSFRSSSEVTFLQKAFPKLTLALAPCLLELEASCPENILCFHQITYRSILESPLTVSPTNIGPFNANYLLVVKSYCFWRSAKQSSNACRKKKIEKGRERKNRKRRKEGMKGGKMKRK